MRLGFRGFRQFGDAPYTGDVAAAGQAAMEDVVSGLRWALTACKARFSLAASPPAGAAKIIADASSALDSLQGRTSAALASGGAGISGWKADVKSVADSIASVAKTLGDSNAASVAMQALDSWEDFDAAVSAAEASTKAAIEAEAARVAAAAKAAADAQAAAKAAAEAAAKAAADAADKAKADAAARAAADAAAKAEAARQAAAAAAAASVSTPEAAPAAPESSAGAVTAQLAAPVVAAPKSKSWLISALIGAGVLFLMMKE